MQMLSAKYLGHVGIEKRFEASVYVKSRVIAARLIEMCALENLARSPARAHNARTIWTLSKQKNPITWHNSLCTTGTPTRIAVASRLYLANLVSKVTPLPSSRLPCE